MNLATALLIGVAFGLSEMVLSFRWRAGSNAKARDRHSLLLIWVVMALAMMLGVAIAHALPEPAWPWARGFRCVGLLIFVAGIALRWYAIVYLGRWFTVNVAIAHDQPLIDSGPYRHLRHPSYTGALMAFLGFSLTLGNLVALLLVMLASITVFSWRIHIEEQVLSQAFDKRWDAYAQRTRRLIPGIY